MGAEAMGVVGRTEPKPKPGALKPLWPGLLRSFLLRPSLLLPIKCCGELLAISYKLYGKLDSLRQDLSGGLERSGSLPGTPPAVRAARRAPAPSAPGRHNM